MRWNTFSFIAVIFYYSLHAQKDSVHIRLPKHYFNSVVLFDYYQKPQVVLDGNDNVSKKIKSYQIQQSILAFSVPFYTQDIFRKDSNWANLSLLFTGYFLRYYPNFSGLSDKHILVKNGLGVRLIYNNGKRSIFFADFSPFTTMDKGYKDTRVVRMASLLLWSFSFSERLNMRLGLTKSFMWGNRYYLPFVGFRFGKINRLHFSIQFPRIISLNLPIQHYFQISLFTKPQGGLFSVSNKDTLYPIFFEKNKVIYLGRYEFLSGLRVDVQIKKFLCLYMAAGQTINNYLALYSLQFNKDKHFSYGHFFESMPAKSFFINFGIAGILGKTKSYYQRKDIDEQIYLNNQIGVGDENIQVHQNTNNEQKKKKPKISNEEVSDLINTFDY